MEVHEANAIPADTGPTRSPNANGTQPANSMRVLRGVRSGEICVRMRHEALCAADGAVHGIADGLRLLAMEPPTLQQLLAPWKHNVVSLKRRRMAVRDRRRLVRDRHSAARSVLDSRPVSVETLSSTLDDTAAASASAASTVRFTAAYHALERLYAQHAMRVTMEHYALLEQESAWIAAWQQREAAACHELLRTTKRRHHLTSFAVHLESETSNQICMWRLQEGDAQRTRCVKAATENVKKGFFTGRDGGRVEVTDVYKIENKPLLKAFEHWVDASATFSDVKIKGLFCCVPTESLEHCVVWGMHSDERELASHADIVDQQVFNRPCVKQGDRSGAKAEAPGTERRFVALTRVAEASAMTFPRRFSRYSTLNEQRDTVVKDLAMREPPVRYLALCRVAMGKIQRVTASAGSTEFPMNEAVGSQFYPEDEEYVVRYPQAIVPEFLVEYRFTQTNAQDTTDASVQDRVLNVDLSAFPLGQDALPAALFQSAAQELVKSTLTAVKSAAPCSLFPSNGSIPSVFGNSGPVQHRNGDHNHPEASLTTESALEKSGRRREMHVEGLQQMRRLLWTQAHAVWSSLNQSRNKDGGEKDEDPTVPMIEQQNGREVPTPPLKKHSFKAKKLYGELALVRQLQEREAVKRNGLIDRLKKPKPSNINESKKPRPFR